MTVYMCDIYKIKKLSQVKAILAFMTESGSSWFLIHYIYTTHAIVIKLDDVRTRNRNVLWNLPYVYQYYVQVRFKILFEMVHSSDQWLVYSHSVYLFCLVLRCQQSLLGVLFLQRFSECQCYLQNDHNPNTLVLGN